MAVSRTTRKLIEGGNLPALEDEWLGRLEEEPEGLEYFVGTARALAGNGHEDASRELLELLDEHYSAEGLWDLRTRLLEGAGPLFFGGEALHAEILASLRALYADSEIRDPLLEKTGLHRAINDIGKTWQKVARFRNLMRFRRGTVVWMEGKGPGTVDDVNVELEKFRVNLGGVTVTVGFGAADKMLQPLPSDSFYARKILAPEELQEIGRTQPAALLQLCLEARADPPSAGDIRQAVTGIISDASWASWWEAARTHPQVLVTGKGAKQRYSWAATQDEASEAAHKLFKKAGLEHKLQIYRREAKKDAAREETMRAALLEIAARESADQEATRFVIGMTLEQAGASELGSVSPASVIADSRDAVALVRSIEDKVARRRALTLLRDNRSDWPEAFAVLLLHEEEPRILSDLAAALSEVDAKQLSGAFDAIVAHPRRRPAAFVWLAENLSSYPVLEKRSPLRLMQLILRASAAREFNPFRSRIAKIIESSDALPHLIANLSEDQVEQAERLLITAAIEDYIRQPLITALHLRFPDAFRRTEDVLYATPGTIASRRRDLKDLLEVQIPANRSAIEEARELGDLRENFEYKSARQRHEYLTARAEAIDSGLRRARAIDLGRVATDEVRIGCRLSLASAHGKRQLSVLGPWESDPEAGVLSYESDTGRRLLGKVPGETVEFDGSTWTIEAIAAARVDDDGD